jgi:hypothetical protein
MQRLKPADEPHAEHRAPTVRRSVALAAVLLLVAAVPLVSRGRPGD